MLLLGVTAHDKGAQLESLIRTVLEQQGFQKVRGNIVGAGGNELDVIAVRESTVMAAFQLTPLSAKRRPTPTRWVCRHGSGSLASSSSNARKMPPRSEYW